ncbi:MAG: host-nuclease inhibitor Gam family protein [Alphaproteobacteria bacterium]
MTTIADIEKLARAYAAKRGALADQVSMLLADLAELKRRRLSEIRKAVARAAEAHGALHAALEAHPELFVKPRSMTFDGIKVGWAKGKGEIHVADAAQVVKLIRRHFPDRFDDLVKVKETPLKSALGRLTVDELKRIGVTVEETGDRVVIKPVDGEVEKLVDALLGEAAKEEDDDNG